MLKKSPSFESSFSLTQSRKLETVFQVLALITDCFSGGRLSNYMLKKTSFLQDQSSSLSFFILVISLLPPSFPTEYKGGKGIKKKRKNYLKKNPNKNNYKSFFLFLRENCNKTSCVKHLYTSINSKYLSAYLKKNNNKKN